MIVEFDCVVCGDHVRKKRSPSNVLNCAACGRHDNAAENIQVLASQAAHARLHAAEKIA